MYFKFMIDPVTSLSRDPGTRHPRTPLPRNSLIPGYLVHSVFTSFIIFQIRQHTCIYADVEVV